MRPYCFDKDWPLLTLCCHSLVQRLMRLALRGDDLARARDTTGMRRADIAWDPRSDTRSVVTWCLGGVNRRYDVYRRSSRLWLGRPDSRAVIGRGVQGVSTSAPARNRAACPTLSRTCTAKGNVGVHARTTMGTDPHAPAPRDDHLPLITKWQRNALDTCYAVGERVPAV